MIQTCFAVVAWVGMIVCSFMHASCAQVETRRGLPQHHFSGAREGALQRAQPEGRGGLTWEPALKKTLTCCTWLVTWAQDAPWLLWNTLRATLGKLV